MSTETPAYTGHTFFSSIKTCFSNYVTFKGRATRSEYWYFMLFCGIIGVIPIVGYIAMIAFILPTLAVTARRLHDTGKSALNILFGLIPIAGPIIMIIFCTKDSEHGTNAYGPSEKYPEA